MRSLPPKATCPSDISTGDRKSISIISWNGKKIPIAPGMNGQHSQNLTKRSEKWQVDLHSTYRLRITLTLTKTHN